MNENSKNLPFYYSPSERILFGAICVQTSGKDSRAIDRMFFDRQFQVRAKYIPSIFMVVFPLSTLIFWGFEIFTLG